jgi:hypothetical protein
MEIKENQRRVYPLFKINKDSTSLVGYDATFDQYSLNF